MKARMILMRFPALLVVLCLLPMAALAGVADSSALSYEKAVQMLTTSSLTDGEKLEVIRTQFEQAGSYQFGVDYLTLTDALIILQEGNANRFDDALDIVRRLSRNEKFTRHYSSYVDKAGQPVLPELDTLAQYIAARKLEAYSDLAGAVLLYDQFPVLDAAYRASLLTSAIKLSQYEKATALLQEGALGSIQQAVFIFEELGDFRDSPQQLQECRIRIIELAPETPAPTPSPTPQPTPTPVAAQTLPVYYRGTDGTLLYTDNITLLVGNSVYYANDAFIPAGYKLVGDRAVNITVAANGIIMPHVIEFLYYKPITVGAIVYFGHYEQDNITFNGKETIAWRILSAEDKKVLLISEKILDVGYYNQHGNDNNTTWETCTLRKWLNSNFVDSAFTHKERRSILTSSVKNDDNLEYGTEGGRDTQDMVFLLSIEEAESFLVGEDDRVAINTQLTNEYVLKSGWWWLRSPGGQDRAAFVGPDGSIRRIGGYVSHEYQGIRPVLWLDLASDIF